LHHVNLIVERVAIIEELLEQFQMGRFYIVLEKERDLKQEENL
jgi:hypothetical protein